MTEHFEGAIVYHIDGVQCMFVTETPDNWENCALTCAANEVVVLVEFDVRPHPQ